MADKPNLELYKLKAELCKTLSDPKRLIIISELRNGEKQVRDLANTPGGCLSTFNASPQQRGNKAAP